MATPEEQIRNERLQKLRNIKEKGINPYPSTCERTNVNSDITADFEKYQEKTVSVVGRIMSVRKHGRITFFSLQDASGLLQILFKEDVLGKEQYKFLKNFDTGDFAGVTGRVFKTNAGEITVEAAKYQFLSKSLLPIPEKFHGLKDVETRYRKRYLDFLVNEENRQKMVDRAKVIKAVRDYLEEDGYLEMQFPALESEATGAAAKPFMTHYKAYDAEVYLRICIGELWQKRAIIGGFEKIFEIGKAFRNEGVDAQHNPEFMMCEFYWAYADYKKMMKFIEQLTESVVKEVKGSLEVSYQGQTINFKGPYPVFSFKDIVLEKTGLDIDKFPTKKELAEEFKKRKFDFNKEASRGTMIDEFYKEFVRPGIIDPVFLTDHPVEISPLAKENFEKSGTVERFQLVINGAEVVNAYSELNDPQVQKERFLEQAKLLKEGDEESQRIDMDYIEAMEYGMPPISGCGIGLERLVMLLTDSAHLRECTPFPFMRPLKETKVTKSPQK